MEQTYLHWPDDYIYHLLYTSLYKPFIHWFFKHHNHRVKIATHILYVNIAIMRLNYFQLRKYRVIIIWQSILQLYIHFEKCLITSVLSVYFQLTINHLELKDYHIQLQTYCILLSIKQICEGFLSK